MTRAERIRLFRPQRVLTRLTVAEREFVKAAVQAGQQHYEGIRLQLATGTRVGALTLDRNVVKGLASKLAALLVDTGAISKLSASREVAEAIRAHKAKTTFSAVQYAPDPDDPSSYYPEAGVRWYQDYALRIVGVQSYDALEQAKEIISEGVRSGRAHRVVMNELRNVFTGLSRARLENIARTETAKIYEQARWQEFDSTDEIVGYEVAAILDLRTTAICRARDGRTFPKDQIEGNLPPYHYQCRTVILPIFAWDAEEKGFAWNPVPKGATPVLEGFGTTSMRIPEPRDRRARAYVKQLR